MFGQAVFGVSVFGRVDFDTGLGDVPTTGPFYVGEVVEDISAAVFDRFSGDTVDLTGKVVWVKYTLGSDPTAYTALHQVTNAPQGVITVKYPALTRAGILTLFVYVKDSGTQQKQVVGEIYSQIIQPLVPVT